MERVKIKLRHAAKQEFRVTLDYREEQDGVLSQVPHPLNEAFKNWQTTYRQLDAVRSYIAPEPGERSDVATAIAPQPRLTVHKLTYHSGYEYASVVKKQLNQWLNSGDNRWQGIREDLIAIAGELNRRQVQVPLLLDADDLQLCRLPWQEWNLFENYGFQPEIALRVKGRPGYEIKPVQPQGKVRILVVVGRSDGIQTQSDLAILQKLKSRGAEVTVLLQPSVRELCSALWAPQGYHIFVFTGHSGSYSDGQIGWIELNQTDSLSIAEFKHAFKAAIDRGLQLAIFNSCDGLGLAHQLAELNLPRSIVMQEPVPDDVAVEFLQHFFDAFSQNTSIFDALHQARHQLEHFNVPQGSGQCYPGVMWLPTLCTRESALEQPFSWQAMLKTWKLPKTRAGLLVVGGVLGLGAALAMLPFVVPSNHRLNTPPEIAAVRQDTFAAIPVPAGTWRYGGSTTWAPIRSAIDAKIQQAHPDFNLVYTQHATLPEGSGTGIAMLLTDQLAFAQSSRPLSDEEYARAQQRGFDLKQVPVAIDAIAIVVHPDLPIDGLSVAQIRDIYAGSITNWQFVGGPDLPIEAYSRPAEAGGTPEFFVENVLLGNGFGNQVAIVGDTTEGIRQVARHPGSIYYASAPELVGQCTVKALPIRGRSSGQWIAPYAGERVPPEDCPSRRNQVNLESIKNGTYPLTRQLFVVIKQQERDQVAGEAYANMLLTDEGQNFIREIGFIPLR